ncbi:hypothetical protein [Halorubrum sp. Ea8]|uniref:hypothetical protein n=1 Tax=Halorubrum sp. Ea8 TaxID=1383841 RepID=UPI000B990CF2|nr:hypothetical protein [Halorubrum sp. Ea8]OYR48179.1 hypothetical protein DJ74_11020 [Halorubrum sp. Ea8]
MVEQLSGRVAASHEWGELELPSAASDRVVLASIDTYAGHNTADVRMRNAESETMELFVEEERSADDEIRHNVEEIGFFATEAGPITDQSGTTIGEAGVVTTDQTDEGEWHTVSLEREFTSPVAFAQVMSYNGSDPCHVRLRSVSGGYGSEFEFQIEEWNYLDGQHTTERIGYVVLEWGTHQLDGGVPLVVGTRSETDAWSDALFGEDLGTDPVLITRCQTRNGAHEVVTRNRRVSGSGAAVRLQEEEARGGAHVSETVGYLAMPQLRSAMPAEHVATTHERAGVRFSGSRPSDPVVLASIDTYNGTDTADVRLRNVHRGGMELFIEEEASKDDEMNHNEEAIGYLRTGTGPLYDDAGARIGEAGVLRTDQPGRGEWHAVDLEGSYANPVAFVQVMSHNGSNPCHGRIRNVSANRFEFQIEEWDYLDGRHDEEEIGYVVIEEGVHDLAGGETVEVGTTRGDDGWTNVGFGGPVGHSPVLVSRSQTYNGTNEIVTRHRNVSASGAEIRVQEEQGRDDEHKTETIGYVAAPRSTPPVTTGLVEATEEWVDSSLAGVPSTDPVALASVETFNGGNPVGVRMRNVGSSGFELFLEEEQSADDDMAHTIEDVAIFATASGRIHDDADTLIGEAGVLATDQPDRETWHTVSLDGSYANPVAFAQLMTYNGENPSHTRIRNVDSGSFDVKIEEWNYLDGSHDREEIGYVVLEEGVHELEGELPIEAGTTVADHEFDDDEDNNDYSYAETFECNPVLVSHCQTYNGWHEIVTRNRNVNRRGADVRVQEEENRDGAHNDETIGYLVAPQLVLGNRRPIDEFRPSCHGFEFGNSFNEMPNIPDLPANIDNQIENIDREYGLCGGMALAAKDFFMHDRAIPEGVRTPQSGRLFNYLWERQLDTFDHASGWNDLAKFLKFYLPSTFTRAKSVSEFRRVKDALDTGRPVVVGLVYVRAGDGQLWDNHQVLAYDYTESGGKTYINIYDPNHPGANDVVIRVDVEDQNWYDPAPGGAKISAEQRRGNTKQHNVIGMIYMDKPAQNPPQSL